MPTHVRENESSTTMMYVRKVGAEGKFKYLYKCTYIIIDFLIYTRWTLVQQNSSYRAVRFPYSGGIFNISRNDVPLTAAV